LKMWAESDPCLGSCSAIWESAEAASASRERTGTWFSEKKMLMGTFIDTLKRLGWPEVHGPETKRLALNALDLHGAGVITRADLEWLDDWKPVEWVYATPDPDAWQELKELLVATYGHPLRAWRKALDLDDSNAISWREFRNACREMNFPKAAGAWRALDADLSTTVSMLEYDPESANLLKSFKEWAEVTFGSIKACFRQLDSNGSGFLTLAELKRGCHKLNWVGDVHVLFESLDVDGAKSRCDYELGKTLSFQEVAFLDTWCFEPRTQELVEQEAVAAPPVRKKCTAEQVSAITNRLTTPIGWSPRSLRRRRCASAPSLVPGPGANAQEEAFPAASAYAMEQARPATSATMRDSPLQRQISLQREMSLQEQEIALDRAVTLPNMEYRMCKVKSGGSAMGHTRSNSSNMSKLSPFAVQQRQVSRKRVQKRVGRPFGDRVDALLKWEQKWG